MISFPGYASKPTDSFNKAARAWRQIEKDASFYVNDEGIACFDPRSIASRRRDDVEQGSGGGNSQSEGESEGGKGEGEERSAVTSSSDVLKKNRVVPFSIYLRESSLDPKDSASKLLCTANVIGRVI